MTFKDWWERHRDEFDPRAETVFADLWRVARAPLESRVAELEAALKPFAAYAAANDAEPEHLRYADPEHLQCCRLYGSKGVATTVGDCRRAAAVFKGGQS